MEDAKGTLSPPRYRDRGHPRVILEPQQIRQLLKEQGVRKPRASDPRGVVLPLVWRRWATDNFAETPEHYALLRKSLLYWDEIVWPSVEFMNARDNEDQLQRMLVARAAIAPDLQFLESAGKLEIERTSILWSPRNITPEHIARTVDKLFLNRDHYEPGIWALADTTDEFEYADPDVPITRAALLRLANVLPAPRDDVPFQDILEFKQKYEDELVDLRAHLDSLYSQIVDSHDSLHQESVALHKLDKAITNLNKAARYSPYNFYQTSVTTVLDLGEHLVAGADIGKRLGLPEDKQLICGGVYGAFRLMFKEQASPRNAPGPYAYLYSARKWDLLARQDSA